jgi:hypothetical protein
MNAENATESDAVCPEYTAIVPFGVREPLPCLLRAPHKGYRHYAVHPDHPDRFWTWDDVIPPAATVEHRRTAENCTDAPGCWISSGDECRHPDCKPSSPPAEPTAIVTKSSGEPVDLLAALQRSLDAAKRSTPPASTNERNCTGASDCSVALHIHGCFADLDGTACDDPGDHPASSVGSEQ